MRKPSVTSVETRLAASPASGKNHDRVKDTKTKNDTKTRQDTKTKKDTKPNKNLPAFRQALLRWYDQNRRDLPWRATHDPYRIWLSEIMLQQTRVAAVLEHYRIFLERFPNVEALAAASEDAVLAAWSGLGYYQRARRLHHCANTIVQKHAARFPQRAEDLQMLPGIGRYTGAAIASIAFAEPVAVVDGNVERVLHRFIGVRTTDLRPTVDVRAAGSKVSRNLTTAQIWQHAQTLLDASRPGDFNQAMMELGATICQPRQPSCPSCPVGKFCHTQQSSGARTPTTTSTKIMERRAPSPGNPPARSRIRQLKKDIWCVLSERNNNNNNDSVLLVRRPSKSSLMPGMWELPLSFEPPNPMPAWARWRSFRHSITITDYTVHVFRHTLLRNTPLRNAFVSRADFARQAKWIPISRIPQIPITGLTRKVLRAAGII